MAMDATKLPLQTIGNYELLSKIAEGGMGTVYRGRNRQTGQIVAIKIVPSQMGSNQVLMKRFEQEFLAASRLDHPNIVRALDYCGTGPTPFLVMEFVDGESLGQKIERDGRMNEVEAIRLIAQVCQGLHRAHKMGMIHRDIKPDNILVTPDGQAKLTDLGLVKEVESELNLTRTGRGLGTPHFMAPEQFRNAKNADIKCDIYSLGATLYMMVTGELPFKSLGPLDAWMKKVNNDIAPPKKLVPTISDRVDWAIRRAMSADPALRPASCREFVEDLTGQSTRKVTSAGDGGIQDLWYLVYRLDDDGPMHTVKGSTEGIRRALTEGLLGDASNIRACRTKQGPFESLKSFPEFRDLVLKAEMIANAKAPAAPAAAPTTPPATPKPPLKPPSNLSSNKWTKVPTPPETATPPPADAPHIHLEPTANPTLEAVKWGLLIAIAIASGVVVSYFLFSSGP
jgi:serine/threonine protein kinase